MTNSSPMAGTTELRSGEQSVGSDIKANATLTFIGRIRTPFLSREDCPRQGRLDGPECRLVLNPEWADSLKGLADYRLLEVLYWLDQSRRDLILQSPKFDGETIGTFALRSPCRPNPIGTTMARLERIEGNELVVRGLDCLDMTPLLDIKPDRCLFTEKAPAKARQSTF